MTTVRVVTACSPGRGGSAYDSVPVGTTGRRATELTGSSALMSKRSRSPMRLTWRMRSELPSFRVIGWLAWTDSELMSAPDASRSTGTCGRSDSPSIWRVLAQSSTDTSLPMYVSQRGQGLPAGVVYASNTVQSIA